MRCPSCHTTISEPGRFCPSCGVALDAPDAETKLAEIGSRLGSPTPTAAPPPGGWLTSSGSIDHGRFTPGAVLDGRYRVIGLIGRGGMGEVYRADDLRLGQPVALKFLPVSLSRDATRLAQFHNEVRTARQVSHPNVCRVYDIGEADGQLYLSMEYVDGEDLAASLRRIGRFPEDRALEIARQICAGLSAAHERGVLHRDLKPANIMIDGTGKVRIMDFSLAAVGAVDDVRSGTPAYMAPEQLEGREVTVRSDIFSLGLVLYELFTGRRAFTSTTLADLVRQQESGDITSPTELVKTLDPSIERGIMRCLERDPARRPATALAVAASLPGGDPLAAALAAGETPSPEMVAAAGTEAATLTPARGIALVTAVVLVLIGLSALSDRRSLVARLPLSKPRAVLIDRAAELRVGLGYTAPPADAVSGFLYDDEYLRWAARHGAGADHWAQLARGRPAALRFWYRTGQDLLVPYDRDGSVTIADPPFTRAGMTRVDLDPQGRLVYFRAVPSIDAASEPSPVNWDPLFQAAGLDKNTFNETTPAVLPADYADEWKAWTGTVPEFPGTPMRVEAAGFRGRPTKFALVGDWAIGQRSAESRPSPVLRFIGLLIIAGVPIGSALLARHNLRLGRGDKRGAFCLWAFAFGSVVISWIISPKHVSGLEEIDRMFTTLSKFLFWSGVLYVVYLALEPYVRRTWPHILITWSRLLSGRIRDPLVGRDLLVGTLAGLLVAIVPGVLFVPELLGRSAPSLNQTSLIPLLGLRELLASIANRPFGALENGLITMLMVAMIRRALRWLADILPGAAGRLAGGNVVLSIVTLILFVIVVKRNSVDPIYPRLDWLATAILVGCLVLVALRFGLFALIVAFLVVNLADDLPLTLDGTKLYAGPVWFGAAIIVALAVLGFSMARGGEPVLGSSTTQ